MALLQGCSVAPADCDQLPQDHAVGNAGCLVVVDGSALLVQQRLGGGWSIPGGTAEPGERAACTAARETAEESGVIVKVVAPLAVLDNGFHIYRCEPASAVVGQSDALEIQQVGWKTQKERNALSWRFPQYTQQVEALVSQQDESDK